MARRVMEGLASHADLVDARAVTRKAHLAYARFAHTVQSPLSPRGNQSGFTRWRSGGSDAQGRAAILRLADTINRLCI